MKHIILLCLVVGLALPGIPHSDAQDSDSPPPYLYYFSEAERGIVIERADGTDRHLLSVDDLIDFETDYRPDTNGSWYFAARDYGWSPSGEWYAGEIGTSIPGWEIYEPIRPFLYNVHTGQYLTLFDEFDYVSMRWAPDRDLLLVGGFKEAIPDDNLEGVRLKFSVINVATSEILAEVALTDYIAIIDLVWTDDGQYAVAHTGSNPADLFYVFDQSGNMFTRTIENVQPEYPSGAISPLTGKHTFRLSENTLWLVDIITGEETALSEVDSPTRIVNIFWNPYQPYAIINNQYPVSLTTGAVETLSQPAGEATFLYSRSAQVPEWSPEGHYYAWNSDDAIYVLEMETGTIEQLPVEDTSTLYWNWISSTTLAFLDGKDVYVYDMVESSKELLLTDLDYRPDGPLDYLFQILADGDYIVLVTSHTTIYDLEADTTTLISPNPLNFPSSGYGGLIRPHPTSEDWFFVDTNNHTAGGGGVFIYERSVMNRDATVNRPLLYGGNWLPPHVDTTALPDIPDAPMPVQTIYGSEFIGWLEWHPEEALLLSSTQNVFRGTNGDIAIWDLDRMQSEVVAVDADINLRPHWMLNEDTGKYFPALFEENSTAWATEHELGIYAVNVSDSFTLEIRSIDTDEVLATIPHYSPFFPVTEVSPDGKYLAVASLSGLPIIIDTSTWEVVATLPHPSPTITFSPDGTQIAVAAAWDIEIWNLADLLDAQPD